MFICCAENLQKNDKRESKLRQYDIKIHNIWQYVFSEGKYIYLYTGTQRYCIFKAFASRGLKNKRISTKPFFLFCVFLTKQATRYIYIYIFIMEKIPCEEKWLSGFQKKKKMKGEKMLKSKKEHTSEQSASCLYWVLKNSTICDVYSGSLGFKKYHQISPLTLQKNILKGEILLFYSILQFNWLNLPSFLTSK